MKKYLLIFLLLSIVSLFCYITFADSEYSTLVEYLGEGTEEFTLTVPAKLAPNTSGEVKVTGVWPSNRQLIVDADNTVELVNEGNVLNKKVLNIDFEGIKLKGNDVTSVAQTENIYVAKMPDDVLFGKWTGKFNYQVVMADVSEDEIITFSINGESYQANYNMTWSEWMSSEFFVDSGFYTENGYVMFRHIDGTEETLHVGETPGDYVKVDHIIIENTNYYSS